MFLFLHHHKFVGLLLICCFMSLCTAWAASPVCTSISLSTPAATAIDFNINDYVSDVDNDLDVGSVSFTIVSPMGAGTFYTNNAPIITFQPVAILLNETVNFTYTISDTQGNSCSNNGTIVIYYECDLAATHTVIQPTCGIPSSRGRINVEVTGGTFPYTYNWSDIPDGLYIEPEDRTNLVGGTYSITITDPNNCTATIQNIVIYNPTTPLPISNGDKTICPGDPIPTLSVSTPAPDQIVHWYSSASGGTPLASNTLSYTPSAMGTYYAATQDTLSGCYSLTRRSITIHCCTICTPIGMSKTE